MASAEQLARFAGMTANEPYLLGRGDVVTIRVEGQPDLTGRQTIGPDGRITLPVAGSVQVSEKTREQAARAIVTALRPYYNESTVTVGVESYSSNKVLLLGAVERPGVQTFDEPPTLLEVLAKGGGALPGADPLVNATPGQAPKPKLGGNLPDRCTIYRGADTVLWVDLKQMSSQGSAIASLHLRRDDVVFVPPAADRTISVIGQVQRPGVVPLGESPTLARVLAEAGGITQQAGKNPKIRIVQPSTGRTRDIAFNDLMQPAGLDITLHPDDLIYVPVSGFNSAAYVLDKLSPLVGIFTVATLLRQ